MAMPHLQPGEIRSLRPLGASLQQTPTTALFKDAQLEVMRVVLPAGKRMPSHAVAGPITVQCIEGLVEVTHDQGVSMMQTGDFLYLRGGVLHALHALEDASLLVTVVLLPHADVTASTI